jgi:hypothetical protein
MSLVASPSFLWDLSTESEVMCPCFSFPSSSSLDHTDNKYNGWYAQSTFWQERILLFCGHSLEQRIVGVAMIVCGIGST